MDLAGGHLAVVERFVECCRADERVLAAFLGGSYARGAADRYSDLDLYVVTTDAAFDEFCAGLPAFAQLLGELLFAESFDMPDTLFFVLADGIEGEIAVGRESGFAHIHGGPFWPLLDRRGLLVGADFPAAAAEPLEQAEMLRRQIAWFWHDLSHFITAVGRAQLWWAQGQLEQLRAVCVNLARLSHDFRDAGVGDEPYFKVEETVPAGELAALRSTIVPPETDALIAAVRLLVEYYRGVSQPLAEKHAVAYPAALEQLMLRRLDQLAGPLFGDQPA